jgi:hypothetical protein
MAAEHTGAVRLNMGERLKARAVPISVAFGLGGIVIIVINVVSAGERRLLGVLFGLIVITCGALIGVALTRPKILVVDRGGIRSEQRRGPFDVAWHELADAHVVRRRSRCWLVLRPLDDAFHARHPEMARLRDGDEYRYRLGAVGGLADDLDKAIAVVRNARSDG